MESHGVASAIHTSKATKDLIVAAGKGHWVLPRTDSVKVKGKGIVKTFFLNPEIDNLCFDSSALSFQANCLVERDTVAEKKERLVKVSNNNENYEDELLLHAYSIFSVER